MSAVASLGSYGISTTNLHPRSQATSNATSPTGTTGSTDTAASTISANDFLTLLVTEMKNQDPTANNDPNQYINQLVQVNSLEQLISINQELSTATTSSGTTGKRVGVNGSLSGISSSVSAIPTSSGIAAGIGEHQIQRSASDSDAHGPSINPPAVKAISGNLSIPEASPAAQTVAHALAMPR